MDAKEKLLQDYGLSEIKENTDVRNWRVLMMLELERESNHIRFPQEPMVLKTSEERYLSSFKICVVPAYDRILVLAEPECSEYYFVDNSDFQEPMEKLKDYIINPYSSIELSEELLKVIKDWGELEKTYDGGGVYNPNTCTWTKTYQLHQQGSSTSAWPLHNYTITCSNKLFDEQCDGEVNNSATSAINATTSEYLGQIFTVKTDLSSSVANEINANLNSNTTLC